MGLKATSKQGDFTPLEAGVYDAVCIAVHDIGNMETNWGIKHKIAVVWEVDERIPDGERKGERYTVWNLYTLSFSAKSALRKDIEAWRGKAFKEEEIPEGGYDLMDGNTSIIGRKCQLSIIHNEANGNVYANVGGITPMKKGAEGIEPEHELGHEPKAIKTIKEKQSNGEYNKGKNNVQEARKDLGYQEEKLPVANEERVPW